MIDNYHIDNVNLYNLVAWIVNPDSSCDRDGFIKLSQTKAVKVKKICHGISSLVPNSVPALSQVMLSLNIYHKTGSSDAVNDLHKLGHRLSYTDTKFIEDKWAEWTENQSQIVPANIPKGEPVVHVVDNIDWKNKDLRGHQKHNTNGILIQPNNTFQNGKTKVIMEPEYHFDRKNHRSFKRFKSQLQPVNFKRADCKKLEYKPSNNTSEYEKGLKQNLAWVMSRYSPYKELSLFPSWSGYQHIIYNLVIKANVGYLAPLTAPPTEMSVIYKVIERSLRILEELELDQNVLGS